MLRKWKQESMLYKALEMKRKLLDQQQNYHNTLSQYRPSIEKLKLFN